MQMELQPKLAVIQSDVESLDNVQGDIDSYMVEVHKKYSIPVACIVFVLLGVPLGALARRSGVGIGVGFSIGFFILYWICLIGGEKLADRAVISPFLGMWGGNIIMGAIGVFLTWRVATEAPKLSFGKFFKPFQLLGAKRKHTAEV
jgi:lipopolysaccharide export system permease protein